MLLILIFLILIIFLFIRMNKIDLIEAYSSQSKKIKKKIKPCDCEKKKIIKEIENNKIPNTRPVNFLLNNDCEIDNCQYGNISNFACCRFISENMVDKLNTPEFITEGLKNGDYHYSEYSTSNGCVCLNPCTKSFLENL